MIRASYVPATKPCQPLKYVLIRTSDVGTQHNCCGSVVVCGLVRNTSYYTTTYPILSTILFNLQKPSQPYNLTTFLFTSTSSISLFTTPGLYLTWLSNLFVGRGFHSLSPELGWNTHLFASPRCTKFIPHARALKNFLGSVGIYSVTIPHSFTGAFLLSRHHESKQRYV